MIFAGTLHSRPPMLTLLAVIAAISFSATSCKSDDYAVVNIDNRLDVPVRVTFINHLGAESDLVVRLEAHRTVALDQFSTEHCTEGVMVARDVSSGAELGRSPDPVCRPSEWVIGGPTSPTE